MRHRHAAGQRGVRDLPAAFLGLDRDPTCLGDRLDDVPAVHAQIHT